MEIKNNDVARAAVGMAKNVDKVRPSVIFAPMRSGWTVSKIVMQVLRSNLGVKVTEYDPPVIPLILNHYSSVPGKGQLIRLDSLNQQKEFREIYPIEKVMLIDHTIFGLSPSKYLGYVKDEITRFGNKTYVNLMTSNCEWDQKKYLSEFLKDKRFKFHFSRLRDSEIPFDDKPLMIGLEYDNSLEDDGLRRHHYEPIRFSNELTSYEDICRYMKDSEEFYKGIKKALDERMWRDRSYRENRKTKVAEVIVSACNS